MRRLAVLLAIAGCEQPSAETAAPPRAWVYPPALAVLPLGEPTGAIGRSQAPQTALREGIEGAAVVGQLRLPTAWQVPGEGPARAIVYGTLAGGTHAIELIDIDAGTITWRDTTGCAAPVVGVTSEVVVCADAKGTRAVGLEGKQRWSTDGATFIALTDDRVAIAGVGEAVIIDATVGDELARVKLPAGVPSDSILASCGDAGRELFAYGQDGKLVRIAEAQGGPKAMWSVPLDTIVGIDACEGSSILVTMSTATGTALVSLSRETGAPTGRVEEVRGYWPARDGSARIEVSTLADVAMWSRDLVGPREHVNVPSLGELLAKRGELRLVRATPLTAAILDSKGVRAFIPLSHLGAALGDRMIIAASWLGSPGETVHRIGIPERYPRALRLSPPRPAVTLPAELRDLPPLVDIPDATATLQAGRHAVPAIALDPLMPHFVHAIAQDSTPDEDRPSAVVTYDLRARTFAAPRTDACGPGTPVGLDAGRYIVCAARGKNGASVRATAREGFERAWEWTGDGVDAIQAGNEIVLVHDADRMLALDAGDGHVLATFQSDDGEVMRAVILDVEGMSLVVTAERGRVVARLPRVQMVPAWSVEVHGVVASLAVAGDGVLVTLEDGDAYRLDARTGASVAVPGLDLVWRATGELITGEAPGGPIPPPVFGPPPAPKVPARKGRVPERDPEAPPTLPKPWPAPVGMRPSWQYTLYEVTGALRARNDFALLDPITPVGERLRAAPLLVQSGPGQREVLVLDPTRGDPLRRVRVPESSAPGITFSTVVDGKPVVGTMLANPLRVVLF